MSRQYNWTDDLADLDLQAIDDATNPFFTKENSDNPFLQNEESDLGISIDPFAPDYDPNKRPDSALSSQSYSDLLSEFDERFEHALLFGDTADFVATLNDFEKQEKDSIKTFVRDYGSIFDIIASQNSIDKAQILLLRGYYDLDAILRHPQLWAGHGNQCAEMLYATAQLSQLLKNGQNLSSRMIEHCLNQGAYIYASDFTKDGKKNPTLFSKLLGRIIDENPPKNIDETIKLLRMLQDRKIIDFNKFTINNKTMFDYAADLENGQLSLCLKAALDGISAEDVKKIIAESKEKTAADLTSEYDKKLAQKTRNNKPQSLTDIIKIPQGFLHSEVYANLSQQARDLAQDLDRGHAPLKIRGLEDVILKLWKGVEEYTKEVGVDKLPTDKTKPQTQSAPLPMQSSPIDRASARKTEPLPNIATKPAAENSQSRNTVKNLIEKFSVPTPSSIPKTSGVQALPLRHVAQNITNTNAR